MLSSLRLRLAAGSVVAIALALLVLWLATGFLFIDYVEQQYKTEMSRIADALAARLKVRDGKLELVSSPTDASFITPTSGRYWQINTADGRIFRSRSLWDVEIPDHVPAIRPVGFGRIEGPDGKGIIVQRTPMEVADQGKTYSVVIHTGFPEDELIAALEKHRNRSQVVMLAAAVLLLGSALFQTSVGLRPLSRLRDQVALVRGGNLSHLDEAVPSEVKPLVNEINLLLAEREAALEKARARASDLAHGLKTPLTVLSQLVPNLPASDRRTAFEQIDLIRQRADRQLQAARLGVEQMQTTDAEKLIRKLVGVLDPVAQSRGLTWAVTVDPDLKVEADAADLAEAIGNLLDNAVKWAAGEISVEATTREGMVAITISDDGPGVKNADRERVLRRGEHLGAEQAGSGLGLAISSDIVTAYGGTLILSEAAAGGLAVTMEIPERGGRRIPPHPV
ncbi:sensor histidine kinase [Rhizobium paknamense]|uniref:histidine kinase n=1 Tax=Rhizobium paknamense TaxID=1206817 RepID=A0ABU0IB88_9HYPH|nr:HAMP domain-containing sensor histidine kinase [Rhizobium paknamense]MDQ0455470.1 signal transduction histidine kinase [Rhizobium paknamense]